VGTSVRPAAHLQCGILSLWALTWENEAIRGWGGGWGWGTGRGGGRGQRAIRTSPCLHEDTVMMTTRTRGCAALWHGSCMRLGVVGGWCVVGGWDGVGAQ